MHVSMACEVGSCDKENETTHGSEYISNKRFYAEHKHVFFLSVCLVLVVSLRPLTNRSLATI